ncbi:MAG: hypothetical protein ACI8ZB_001831 [Desulforhopalus sp.]|jgi:hypothetical protein
MRLLELCLGNNYNIAQVKRVESRANMFWIVGFCLFCLSVLSSGCAQMYSGVQAVVIDSCYSLPYSEQHDCIEQVRCSQEAYEQDKEKAQSVLNR